MGQDHHNNMKESNRTKEAPAERVDISRNAMQDRRGGDRRRQRLTVIQRQPRQKFNKNTQESTERQRKMCQEGQEKLH